VRIARVLDTTDSRVTFTVMKSLDLSQKPVRRELGVRYRLDLQALRSLFLLKGIVAQPMVIYCPVKQIQLFQ